MAAPRATQFIALRNLARGNHQVRSLHMTGPATYASPILHRERPVLNLPHDLASLRAECKRRKIESIGSKKELIARLNADELVHSRAFSTAFNKSERTSPEETTSSSKPAARHFNTSRELKTVNDSSTIDFAYLPDVLSPENVDIYSQVRVPIIPTPDAIPSRNSLIEPEEVVVMKPQISTMSADAVFLPFSESHDGHAIGIDFHAMADRVASNLRSMRVPVEEQAGIMKQVWNDMVDDMMGLRKQTAA